MNVSTFLKFVNLHHHGYNNEHVVKDNGPTITALSPLIAGISPFLPRDATVVGFMTSTYIANYLKSTSPCSSAVYQ